MRCDATRVLGWLVLCFSRSLVQGWITITVTSADLVYNSLAPISVPVVVTVSTSPLAVVVAAPVVVAPPLTRNSQKSSDVVLDASTSRSVTGGRLSFSWRYVQSFTQACELASVD